jgi:hypothetical protein
MTMSKRKMLAEVPKADVVVVNPTHIAVALRYDRKTMKAPKIVAKGIRLNALKSGKSPRSTRCRSSKTSPWPGSCSNMAGWVARFLLSYMPPWPKYWPGSIASMPIGTTANRACKTLERNGTD